MKFNNIKKGFTLAETLITLGIIGIISVLTLPTLISNYKTKVQIAQLQKVYNQLSNAALTAIAEENVNSLDETDYLSSIGNAIDFFKKYLKVSKVCGTNVTDCVASSYKSLDGTETFSLSDSTTQCVMLNTGAALCVPSAFYGDNIDDHGNISVIVDVNGQGSPNTNGRDLFQFDLYSDGVIGTSYMAQDYTSSGEACEAYKSTGGYGGSCFAKVIADGWKMDY